MEHQFSFDFILFCADSLCILDNGLTVFAVDKIGIIGTLPFQEIAGSVALRRDKHILYLLTEIRDKAGALHQLQFVGSAMFLFGVVAAGLLCTILVAFFGAGATRNALNSSIVIVLWFGFIDNDCFRDNRAVGTVNRH